MAHRFSRERGRRLKVDYLIVGAGFTGAVLAERIASQRDKRVLVVERRDHIGGNAYDYYDEHGVLVHKYGPHIFHTNSPRIWDYLSQFTSWRPYFHHVRAQVEGKLVPVPFNLNSLNALFPRSMAERLERQLIDQFGFGAKIPILKMLEESDAGLKELARYVYRNIFEGYTIKQWGLKPEDLDDSVTGRVPLFVSRDDRYFQDHFQAIPRLGYTEMFRSLLSHPNIRILLKTDYRDIAGDVSFDQLIFTGPIDEYFDFLHGSLPYRSLRFEFRHDTRPSFQETGQINYPNEYAFTRVTEFKHLTGQEGSGTTLAYEYSEPHLQNVNDPYYPIPKTEHREQHSKYLCAAKKERDAVIFAGRLADYKYYNMDQAVGRALKVFDEINTRSEVSVNLTAANA
jgi:UDP-galactopyranose mutase